MKNFFAIIKKRIFWLAYVIPKLPFLVAWKPRLAELSHLPYSVLRALFQVVMIKDIDDKIRKGYFKDRLVVVAGLPKSASSLIGTWVANVQKDGPQGSYFDSIFGYGRRAYGSYMLANWDSGLRPELALDFPCGGVIKYHPRANGANLKFLDLLGCKYVITLRHPADQMIALLCHYKSANSKNTLLHEEMIYDHLFPLEKKFFLVEANCDDAIKTLIKDGYLRYMLDYMVEWLKFRNKTRSMVVTFEGIMTDPKLQLESLAQFINAEPLDNSTLNDCLDQKNTNKSNKIIDPKIYPRGYTGEIGVWKRYMIPENIELYQQVVKNYMEFTPNANLLLEYYPDLLIEENQAENLVSEN